MDKVEYSPIIDDPNAEPRKKNWKVIIGVVVMVIVVIVLIVVLTDSGDWSEWTAERETPLCGSGEIKYKRTCTLKSISQAFGRKCSDVLGLGEEKVEKYDLGKCPRVGRYVWLERVERAVSGTLSDAINLGEVQVLSPEGVNIAKGADVTAGSLYSPYPAKNLVDGNATTIAHTADNVTDITKHWFKIDLGSDQKIKEVIITNRNVLQNRINGTRVRIQNDAGMDVYTSAVIKGANSSSMSYTFDATF